MNLHMTGRAVRILRVLVVLWACGLNCANVMRHAVARQTKLVYRTESQQPWIGGTMWRVASGATFGLERRVFKSKRSLLISVTLNARRIRAGRQSRLLEFKSTVRVMAVTALHGSFEHFMMEGRAKRRLYLTVTTQAELRIAGPEHRQCREARLFRISWTDQSY